MTTAEWDAERPSSRRHAIIGVAVVPWIALVVLVLRGGGTPAPSGPGEGAAAPIVAAPPTAPTVAASAAPEPAPPTAGIATSPGAAPADTVVTSGGLARASLLHVTAVALASARDHLGGAAPPLLDDPPGPADRYVEHLQLEALDHPAPGAVVAVVAAIVLHRGEDGFDRAELVRLAVPLLTDGGMARLAGAPWRLPAADLEVAAPTIDPLEDPDLLVEAGRALTAAGYRDVEVVAMGRTATWALAVTVTATAPGEDEPRQHEVWLRPHLDGLVVAGWRPEPQEATP